MSTLSVNTVKSLGTGAPVFQNSSGTEKGRLAKAYVNFDGTGTLTSSNQSGVRDSFNVAAVIDDGTGKYTVTFTNQMSDANYVTNVSQNFLNNTNTNMTSMVCGIHQQTTTNVKVYTTLLLGGGSQSSQANRSATDCEMVYVVVFGG
tara:strand:+ start:1527 stop:1967 length:441 start_codon:yes stop_codon:yes gene_type:complete